VVRYKRPIRRKKPGGNNLLMRSSNADARSVALSQVKKLELHNAVAGWHQRTLRTSRAALQKRVGEEVQSATNTI
jgi:hypothetical protein